MARHLSSVCSVPILRRGNESETSLLRLSNTLCNISGTRCTGIVVVFLGFLFWVQSSAQSVPPIATILFAGRTITIIPRKSIVMESPASLALRVATAHELSIRIVKDVDDIALSVDGAVRTPEGLAWMELDTGNGGSLVIADHIAPLLGLKADISTPEPAHFLLANGMAVDGKARTRDLIMDGNIGAQFLNNWNLTLHLQHGRAWLSDLR